MSKEAGFVSRWSRLKQAAKSPAETPAEIPVEPDAQETVAETPELSEAELVEQLNLPSIEQITIETDIRAFLDVRVPATLRAAALRRAWTLDPAIRDYINPACEYAYNWNIPGDVPGFGELEPRHDVSGLIERLLGGKTDTCAYLPQPVSADAEAPASDDAAAQTPPADLAVRRTELDEALDQRPSDHGRIPAVVPVATDHAVQQQPQVNRDERPQRRRHGGAMPGFDPA